MPYPTDSPACFFCGAFASIKCHFCGYDVCYDCLQDTHIGACKASKLPVFEAKVKLRHKSKR